MTDISDDERCKIAELRRRVEESPTKLELSAKFNTDYNLLRYVRGFEEIDRAFHFLQRTLIMRRVLQLDTVTSRDLTEPGRIGDAGAPVSILGRCRPNEKGRTWIAVVELHGKIDVGGLMQSIQASNFLLHRFKALEGALEMVNAEELRTGQMSGVVLIYDLEGLQFDPSLLGVVTGPFKNLWGILAYMYPDLYHRFLIINAPTFINILWSAFSPFLPERSKEKVIICGENWKEQLLEYIDPEQLPVKWGGTRVGKNGDEACSDIIRPPLNPIPKELLWQPKEGEPKIDDLTEVVVDAGYFELLSYEVVEANTTMDLYIYGKEQHGFGIYFSEDPKEDDPKCMEMVYAEDGYPGLSAINHIRLKCPKAGIYHLKFGNEEAWIYSITIRYLLNFVDAGGEITTSAAQMIALE